MTSLTLQISSSIIFAQPPPAEDSGAVAIFVGSSAASQQEPLKAGPENPLYRLPQSISSGGLKIHLNNYVKPKGFEKPTRRSLLSSIDEDHVIYEIRKASVGEGSGEYFLTNHARDDGEGSYGRGKMKFTRGWISGGTWNVTYVYKTAGQVQESRIDLQVDEGGWNDMVWKMTFPMEGVVAKEFPQEADAFGENGRSMEIFDGTSALQGWTQKEWRDFLTACWITKVWNQCTRTGWFSSSIRKDSEVGNLRTY
ncbi:hypothetical protein FN846DRAFT_675706 [Sphaerosporella brunnea]|uniref:Uncharacterized protein n=1 Tax=Sphaerosporella brunnea TaxID=1250544 RepID=A0A5J5F9X6_9PEZI|nr:hypothetical protein FN846DRAFT_675706 [Sphaerosporella brunnea]